MIEERIQSHANRIALEEAIAERWSWRSWYRTRVVETFGHRWPDLEEANTAQLRRLVRLLRRERAR